MKKLFLTALFALTITTQVQAICLTTTSQYSGSLPANAEVTAYGPFSVSQGSSCLSIGIESKVEGINGRYTPLLILETLEGSRWNRIQASSHGSLSTTVAPGTYRVRHHNERANPMVYSGSTSIKR
jgi:hypothetical protein